MGSSTGQRCGVAQGGHVASKRCIAKPPPQRSRHASSCESSTRSSPTAAHATTAYGRTASLGWYVSNNRKSAFSSGSTCSLTATCAGLDYAPYLLSKCAQNARDGKSAMRGWTRSASFLGSASCGARAPETTNPTGCGPRRFWSSTQTS